MFVRGTDDPDWNDWLENVGLELVTETEPGASPFFGFSHRDGVVTTVWAGGPAERGGLQPDDRLVAINRFDAARPDDVLMEVVAGESARFHVFRRGELFELELTPQPPLPTSWHLREREGADL